ncbi:MAG TPA: N-formylglutamate deformylase [Patescibacteria group bacterium]|nr:N-formylglutamate deformylase [Patescibacteria group bacterium]
MKKFNYIRGEGPLLISIPHMGTHLPADLKHRMTPAALQLSDTDWHVDKLYLFAREIGASILMATHSRYVIDLNRPQDDQHLYPGQVKTGLCPLETFDGARLYKDGEEFDEIEKLNRIAAYWLPYHEHLAQELARIKEKKGYAILYDAHSIRTEVPRLFDGKLCDLNLGTAHNTTAAPEMASAAFAAAEASGYTSILNGRFVGGYITRHYGQPANDVHAIQMELTWGNYMEETPPYLYAPAKAERLQAALKTVVSAILDWGKGAYGRV